MTPTKTATSILNPANAAGGPTATQSGIASNCNNYAKANRGDNCYGFALANNITPTQLYAWNLVLGPNGANCSVQFQAEEYYCVGVVGSVISTSTTATIISKTFSIVAPSPTQSGIALTCNKYAEAHRGDGCYNFALAQGIKPDELYAWNKILGNNGADCSIKFQAGVYYCIGVF